MLTVSDLKVDIQGSRILNGIDLTANPGELVCRMGRTGAGKSTSLAPSSKNARAPAACSALTPAANRTGSRACRTQ